jgi:pimeloyl-ACP methyl ester carboxylesterase
MNLNDTTSTTPDTRAAMARPWAALAWKSYLPKLYAGQRPADFEEYRDRVVASLRRPGYTRAFSLTTRTSHAPAEVVLGRVAVPVLVIMGDRDPDFGDPAGEAAWIAAAVGAQGVAEAGHYPQSQRPDLTPTRCWASWRRCTADEAIPASARRRLSASIPQIA